MSSSEKMPDFTIKIETINIIPIKDNLDDVVGECGLWIAQERRIQINLPEYTWDCFDKIKKRYAVVEDEDVYV